MDVNFFSYTNLEKQSFHEIKIKERKKQKKLFQI